ncbi:K02A2.6-like [Cordylochernes scorpioides]|uniref:K02A2.6-like n=1 Tax=Cordylochernes scorpioides TaxID=51811 RepID=A0ABY6LFV6_9ARAC|nr:K02A2.6-like [Cordylochernes scorpioides]
MTPQREQLCVEDSSNLDDDEGECRRRWTAEIQVNGKQVKFKLDSQADVTCVPLCLFKKIMGQQRLVESDINIRAAEFSELQTVGMFISTLRNGNYEIKEKIYVIRRLSEPLLSRRACELLNLARRIEVVATRINPIKEFPEVFEGLGQIGNPYEIKLKPGAKPYAVHTPRRVPIPLMEKLKTRLEELEKAGIIAQVNVATEWCAPTVIAGKPNGDIRICVDLSRLNEHVQREVHPMPVVEHMLGQLGEAKFFLKLDANSGFHQIPVQREVHPMPVVEHMLGQLGEARFFSKLDANSGFHQIPLSPDCQHLTTFITPFGRYKYCRMPFGISLAPEYFQKVMSIILQGMDGVMCYLDDILIFASDSKTHDRILRLVLRKLKEAKVTLNKAKCVFGVPRINFLGHIQDEDGIRPDPAKIEAVAKMPAPTNVHGVRRFLGMVNHLGRFVENLSEIVAPLNQLLVKGQDFVWDCSQERAFRKLKELLTTQPILAAIDIRKRTMVSSDASSYGLGAVLKQEGKNGIRRPVAYSSRTMTPTEKRYAQIEKEALAITWACERFQDFLLGKRFRIETDHKPLISLFSTKELSSLTPRLQRFRMRMMRFGFEIVHIPGKELLDAEALSRQPLLTTDGGEDERPTSAHMNAVLSCITDKDEMLTNIFEAQQEDTTLKAVVNYLEQGWPDKKRMSQALLSYWHVKDESAMKLEILDKLHAGHFGITKTRLRARETVWWPDISEEIAETVRKCSVCIQEAASKHEPLIPTNFPTRPWQKIGMDLFKFENKWYLVVIDYYSRFPEMIQLDRLTANVVVRSCKSIFARHGIPETVVSDNGTQFGAAREFANFARQYGFTHVTSSPRFPQSNGMAEAGVKIAKLILKKNQDPSLGLLEYRSTPLENGYSPAELLMGRKLRTTLPIAPENLNPKLVDSQTLKRKEGRRRKDIKSRYDRRCGATDMEELSEVGTLRRTRFHLRKGDTVQYPADPSTTTFSGEELVEMKRPQLWIIPLTTQKTAKQDRGISKTTIGRIVTEDLKLKKTPAKFIPRFLTNEQIVSACNLQDKIIIGDETWVYCYDPEIKHQSAEGRGQEKNILLALSWILVIIPRIAAQPSVTLPDTGTVITGTQHTVSGKSLDVYLSIPYAQPPTGERRFKDPEPITNLPPQINATQFPPSCYQKGFKPEMHANKEMSEDCLFLNIWAPSNRSNMAVLIHIYGGGFEIGSSDYYEHNPQYLSARTNMVVVSFNYRLSSLGFLDLNREGFYGNMGLKDQILAFKWVKKYIRIFGGNPNKVTLYGLSSGSMSIAFHLSIAENKNLFKRAFLQSGVSNNPFFHFSKTRIQKGIDLYYQVLNCNSNSSEVLQCLQSKAPEEILKAEEETTKILSYTAFWPKLNGKLLPFTSILDFTKKNIILKKDIIIGFTKDEGSLETMLLPQIFASINATKQDAINYIQYISGQSDSKEFTQIANTYLKNVRDYDYEKYGRVFKEFLEDAVVRCPVFYFSNIMASKNNRVFFYYFTYQTKFNAKNESTRLLGAVHGEDQQYVLGLPLRDYLSYTPKEITFSNRMMDYVGNFAKKGSPRRFIWPRYRQGASTPPYKIDQRPHLLAELNANYYKLIALPKRRRCTTLWRPFFYPSSV